MTGRELESIASRVSGLKQGMAGENGGSRGTGRTRAMGSVSPRFATLCRGARGVVVVLRKCCEW